MRADRVRAHGRAGHHLQLRLQRLRDGGPLHRQQGQGGQHPEPIRH